MLSPIRTLVFLAFALQAMLGPAHLTIEVCHGSMQLPASDGSSCCGASHGHDEGDENPEVERDGECSDCFNIELTASEEATPTPDVFELDSPTVAVVPIVNVAYVWPVTDRNSVAATRAPPTGVTPPGLLPGAFPLRI